MGLSLLDLPEELLLTIMKLLDPSSIQCLRRTNRIFLRLFSSSANFQELHHYVYLSKRSDSQAYPRPFLWRRANQKFEREAYSEGVRDLLRSEESRKQCLTCQNTSLQNPQLATNLTKNKGFCSACGVEHPAAFFRASERDNGRLMKDTCIGQTGHVRLCEHKVITRGEIEQRWSSALRLGNTDTDPGAKCIFLKRCSHASHAPKVKHGVTGSEGMKMCTYPEATLWRRGFAVVLTLRWTGHICQLSHDTPMPAALMEERIRDMRRGAAEYIVPQATPGALPEMRCFDPNKCGCLDFGSRYPPNSVWAGTPLISGKACCLIDPSRRLLPLTAPRAESALLKMSWGESGAAHFTLTRLSDALREFSGYSITARQCSPSAQCLQVFYCRRIACGPAWQPAWRTVDYAWIEALDPDSYSLREDQGTMGALWCVDPSCTNFYRYLRRPVVRKCCRPAEADFFHPQPFKGLVPSHLDRTWYKTQRAAAIRPAEQPRREPSTSGKAPSGLLDKSDTNRPLGVANSPGPHSQAGTLPAAVGQLPQRAAKGQSPTILGKKKLKAFWNRIVKRCMFAKETKGSR
ncbi:hypothetical protein B0T25DRAFT_528670 [Lasiosphaeria hispida]|uniref:F-box domain-containing protein n=1 Tax=Lasiosphaeria hispida TaxID=260671 RepID=A0AAJ0HVX3_9PEZI|nr:hypothetical protein B0T25DRAFT_528670 [Lasiosphaeria hispida]